MAIAYDYYPAVLYALDQISQGHTVTTACDLSNITIAMFEKLIASDETLQDMFTEATRRGNDALADALINIDNHKVHGHSNPQMAKVVSDNIKWVLSKRDRQRFGDKLEVEHNVTVDVAITTALDAARRRIAAPDDVIDAEIVDDDIAYLLS